MFQSENLLCLAGIIKWFLFPKSYVAERLSFLCVVIVSVIEDLQVGLLVNTHTDMKVAAFWGGASDSLAARCQRFEGKWCLHFQS